MGNSSKKIRADEMWCPECGAPIKKGFLTCSNCKLKVRMTQEINRKKDEKQVPAKMQPGNAEFSEKIPLNESGHPKYWNF